ncbi:hypothetical protein I3843_14G025800 [Carya illinoinensis]|uniref:SBP-type domain-containing protein n=2 Tax=Carya illinoinensis TaxID=32201 RepID=A0A8T1NDZ6_CARIL|nr:squamosa promoter-binding-like protein 8 [Carya illinoinensis]KAG6628595.1 hypothetical protein CIPAW_14G024100 [Carya illinoinensis]KAG6677440.1 hypothetical protein I3842_14G026700 [Carya illinoinensis]KAG7946179.1 hypothetical protein I3843_14G025800 [Carya illinoinensis]
MLRNRLCKWQLQAFEDLNPLPDRFDTLPSFVRNNLVASLTKRLFGSKMLEYEWGNPASTIMLSAEQEPASDSDQTPQIFDHYTQAFHDNSCNPQPTTTAFCPFIPSQNQTHPQPHHSLFDPRAYSTSSSHYPPTQLLTLDPLPVPTGTRGGGYLVVPKSEEVSRPPLDFVSRLGLNLGGRTYFSSAEDELVNRLYPRSRQAESGPTNSPRCQAEGCNADLSHAKHYHRRHKVCEYHSKASTVIAAGLTQRFCQQCSRFHLLSEFDNGKRSCRKRLADHNRRRRKIQQQNQEIHTSQLGKAHINNSSSDKYLTRSPLDSGAHSMSSVSVTLSPARMSLDCFRQRPYQATASSASSSSFLFSSG